MKIHFKKYMERCFEADKPVRPILGNIKVEGRENDEELEEAENELQLDSDEDQELMLVRDVPVMEANETAKPLDSIHEETPKSIENMHAPHYADLKDPEAMEGTVTNRLAAILDRDEDMQKNLLN